MYLEELLPYLREGGKIRHADWREGLHASVKDDCLVFKGVRAYPYYIDNLEILSDKWEIYNES